MADIIDEALALVKERKPLIREQRDRIHYWDYFIYWCGETIRMTEAKKKGPQQWEPR